MFVMLFPLRPKVNWFIRIYIGRARLLSKGIKGYFHTWDSASTPCKVWCKMFSSSLPHPSFPTWSHRIVVVNSLVWLVGKRINSVTLTVREGWQVKLTHTHTPRLIVCHFLRRTNEFQVEQNSCRPLVRRPHFIHHMSTGAYLKK